MQQKAIALVNAHRIPPSLQDSLMSGVNALTAETPVCLPPVRPAPAAAPPPPPKQHGHDHGHDHGHGKGGD